ncbi:MAG TPA: L-ribulose-5-phosphate 4-epimerase AraD [Armatimonadota bacterium]|jgi:L-ribulose-5-phosphate 4-epimerase
MLEDLKARVCEANLALQRAGLVLLTWGNVSGRDPNTGLVVIKPSGVSYGEMQPEQMVVVDPEGVVVEGDLRPSSDTPTHLVLYSAFTGVGGVAHTHSTYATAWAQAGRALPCFGTTHADSFRGTIPVTAPMPAEAILGDYEVETGHAIVRAFAEVAPSEVPAVLVAGHGPFTWGPSAEHAVENSIVLEQVALCGLLTRGLAPEANGISKVLLDKHFLRKHGTGAYYGQPGERA